MTTERNSPSLLVGPLLRRVVGSRATVWVETDRPGEVEVRAGDAGGRAATFSAFGHHYALVVVEGLEPGTVNPYDVFVGGEHVWPPADSPYPPCVIRTRSTAEGETRAKLVFGSCRETTQHATTRKLPPDALDAFARRLMRDEGDAEAWPDLLVLLGDQVYADKTSPTVRQYLAAKQLPRHGPAEQVHTFDEYTKLYLESWGGDPEIRWLFSTVPSVMMFDDHEVIDDWNSSSSWRAEMRAAPWWPERISSGLASYWVYQHMGNLSPDELAVDALFPKVAGAGDATDLLRDFGSRVDQEADVGHDPESWQTRQYQWSFAVDLGRTRLVVLDNRCSRVLDPAHRSMLPPAEWAWFLDQAHGSYDHLVVGSSLPWLMPPAIHYLEAWNEKVSASPNPRVAAFGEKVRRAVDLEHWAAFQTSFEAMAELFRRLGRGSARPGPVGAGEVYAAPASISMLGGDVHHTYVARARLGADVVTPVHQLTCSPIHNQVPAFMRPLMRIGWSRWGTLVGRALARTAGVGAPTLRWKKIGDGPYFGNAVSTLVHRGREARVTVEGTTPDGDLTTVTDVALTTP